MSVEYTNIVNRQRTKLETLYSLFIDVCNACNFKCKFCAIQYAKEKLPEMISYVKNRGQSILSLFQMQVC